MQPVEQIDIPQVNILGSRLSLVRPGEAVDLICGWIDDGRWPCRHVVNTGFHGLWEAYKDAGFGELLNSADLWVPDGIAPVWIARLKGLKEIERGTGVEMMETFFRAADRKGYSSFFYGDTEDTLQKMKTDLQKRYPGHNVAGVFSPPFRLLSSEEEEEIIEMINAARPDVLWVGLGTPKQERWIHEHRHRLRVPVAIGVGACFLFLAGKIKPAPDWAGRNGLEWLWRLAQEPKKLWRRDFIEAPRFLWHVALELTGIGKKNVRHSQHLI
jgi:N-acetylglucosaminyldiphosphoundecaprenol N-acetyl-beta-D-mannosaminyltransferase